MIDRRRLIVLLLLLVPFRSAVDTLAPSALPITDLDHLSLHVSDARRSAEFYTALFGTEVSRDLERQANPGSVAGELWFIRLGDSHLSLSPLSPGESPGLDHLCFSVAGFDRAAMQNRVAAFAQPWPEWPSGLWIKDPDEHIIQLAASTSAPRLPAIVRDAVLVPPLGGRAREPLFQPLRITHLTIASQDVRQTHGYYRRLLGDAAADGNGFRIGQARLLVASDLAMGSFQVAVTDFEPNAALTKLKQRGIAAQLTTDGTAVWFVDPDRLRVQLGRN